MFVVLWSKDGQIILTVQGTSQVVQHSNDSRIHHVANGEISIQNISLGDAGVYRIKVYYSLTSNLSSVSDSTHVSIKGRKLLVQ